MNRKNLCWMLAVIAAVLVVPGAWGQMTTFRGKITAADGQPVAGAVLQMTNRGNGRKYDLKSDKTGRYFSLGILAGVYDIKVMKDGQVIYTVDNFNITLAQPETVLDIDLKQNDKQAVNVEEQKREEARQKEVQKLKGLNEMLAQANAAEQAGNFDQAIQLLTQATTADATRDLLWFKLADAERLSGNKITSPSEKTERYQKAIEHYKKAISIKPDGAYYNNLGETQVKSGDTAAALASYTQAAQTDPSHAGQYYFNEGAVLTNMGKVDEAIQAFDKTIQADPAKADAYYWKGVNLLGKATTKGNKMEAPEGTAEAFNKYLELQPTGQFAEPAKQMLSSIGASVETSFGKGKSGSKTKK